jgi:DNA-binding response OmpR family regulator
MIPLLLVEDDRLLAEGLMRVLSHEGFHVHHLRDGIGLPGHVSRTGAAVVLLDLGLPTRDGFAALADLRAAGSGVPVLILTARGAQADIVRGLDLGADGYLSKPFGLPELLARIRALLRRSAVAVAPIELPGLRLDCAARTLAGDAATVELTRVEAGILAVLAATPGAPVPRRTLIERVWSGMAVTERAVDFHMVQLRRKIAMATGRADQRRLRCSYGRGFELR